MKRPKTEKPDIITVLCIILGTVIAVSLVLGIFLWKGISDLGGGSVEIVKRQNSAADYSLVDESLQKGAGSLSSDHISSVGGSGNVPIYAAGKLSRYVTNILLVVQDGMTASPSHQADLIMLFSYNEAQQKISSLSVLRDAWLEVEGNGFMRLADAYAAGGIGLLVNTVNDYYSLDIQNYAVVGTTELKNIIDKTGGIAADLTEEEAQYLGLLPGKQTLDGDAALAYALDRTSGGNGEFSRAGRQCALVGAFIRDMRTHMDDEEEMKSLKDFIFSGIDTNINLKFLANLGKNVIKADEILFSSGQIPMDGCWEYAVKDGETVISVNRDDNNTQLKEELFSDKKS